MATQQQIDEARLLLRSVALQISGYSQSDDKFGAGACHGMTLDWVRLQLKENQTFKQLARVDRAGDEHAADRADKRTLTWHQDMQIATHAMRQAAGAAASEQHARTVAELSRGRQEAVAWIEQFQEDLARYKGMQPGVEKQAFGQTLVARAKHSQAYKDRLLEIQRDLDGWKDRCLATGWKTFVDLWGEQFGRDSTSDFSGINGMLGTFDEVQCATTDAWKQYLRQRLAGMRAGPRCAVLMLNGLNSGHAIAFRRVNANLIRFFDPDFGEYQTSVSRTVDALGFLLDGVYRDLAFTTASWCEFHTD